MISYNTRKWLFVISVFSMACIATLIILQITTKNNSAQYDYQPIQLLPSFQVRIEWLHLFVVILYTSGLVFTSTAYVHWYFIPLAVFITLQLIYTTWLLLDRESYIRERLEISWQDAFSKEAEYSGILINIQEQWQCQGFISLSDCPALLSQKVLENVVISPCYPILSQTFGPTVFIWGIGLWVVKLIQAIGLVACYAIYIHINYTFISNERAITIEEEDVENNNNQQVDLLSLEDSGSDDDSNSIDSNSTIVEATQTNFNKKMIILTDNDNE